MANNEKLNQQARVNSKEQFRQVFEPEAIKAFVSRLGRNQKIVNNFMSNEDMRKLILNALLQDVYENANSTRL